MREKERKEQRIVRAIPQEFTTREDGEDLTIEGYFAVFNSTYDIGYGMSESIAPGAFDGVLADDVRALVNHDSTLVLGRTKAGTLSLSQDSRGLRGSVKINPNDQAARDLYERVKRGDVDGCSFGFDIGEEETEYLDNGDVHWTITRIAKLYEVSACTFPAYTETDISARAADRDAIEKREAAAWREKMKQKLKGE